MNYRFILRGKAAQVFRTFAKLVVADRLLENKYGERIELSKQITVDDFKERLN